MRNTHTVVIWKHFSLKSHHSRTFIFLPTLPFTIPIIINSLGSSRLNGPWLTYLDVLSAPFYFHFHSYPAYTAVAHNFSHFSANILSSCAFLHMLSYHVIDFNSVRTLIYIGACCVRHKCILQTEGNPGSPPSSGIVLLQGCNFLLICHIVQCRSSQVLVPTDQSHLLPVFVWPTN